MRYSRTLCAGFEELLMPNRPLHFLVEAVLDSQREECPVPMDMQLREQRPTGKVAVYVGLTKIVELSVNKSVQRVKVGAHPYYREHFGRYGLESDYGIDQADRLALALSNYLKDRISFVNSHQYRHEGLCQGWLSCRFGIGSCPGEWILADREMVLGYANEHEKSNEWTPIKNRFDRVGISLPEKMRDLHGIDVQRKTVGNELDCAFWNPSKNELILAEVKHGSSAMGVYLSVIQVAAYLAVWRRFAEAQPADAAKGITGLLEQKKRLGLVHQISSIPEQLLPNMIRPAIIVQDPNFKSGCWKRMTLIREIMEDVEPGCLDGLQIYGVQNKSLTNITDQAFE